MPHKKKEENPIRGYRSPADTAEDMQHDEHIQKLREQQKRQSTQDA